MDSYVKIETLDNLFEAQRLGAILEEKEIPHVIESFHDSAYNGLFQSYRGWGSVQAPDEYREIILEIIKDIRRPVEE
jgi:hypothetical protein